MNIRSCQRVAMNRSVFKITALMDCTVMWGICLHLNKQLCKFGFNAMCYCCTNRNIIYRGKKLAQFQGLTMQLPPRIYSNPWCQSTTREMKRFFVFARKSLAKFQEPSQQYYVRHHGRSWLTLKLKVSESNVSVFAPQTFWCKCSSLHTEFTLNASELCANLNNCKH